MPGMKRPPDILRKSHAHEDEDERARGKRDLADALEEAMSDESGADADARGKDKAGIGDAESTVTQPGKGSK